MEQWFCWNLKKKKKKGHVTLGLCVGGFGLTILWAAVLREVFFKSLEKKPKPKHVSNLYIYSSSDWHFFPKNNKTHNHVSIRHKFFQSVSFNHWITPVIPFGGFEHNLRYVSSTWESNTRFCRASGWVGTWGGHTNNRPHLFIFQKSCA